MITFNTLGVHGQLGNQMFQYAILQGISSLNGAEVVFEQEIKNQSYLFDIFNIRRYKIVQNSPKTEYREKNFNFNKEVFTLDNVSLFGYFQSEKYFKHCSDIIRREFTFKAETYNIANEILASYKDKNLVSVHVRRGDYLINPDFHPLPGIKYYENAFNKLDQDNTIFVCVSDDINWCRENFTRKNIIFENNILDVDMCLISLCNNHIIANSSFSWWGSWLSQSVSKKVIAPAPWFGPRAKDYNTSDLYREDFIIL